MKKIVLLITTVLIISCSKAIQPSDLEGEWRATHEEWTRVEDGGETTTATFDSDITQIGVYGSMKLLNTVDNTFIMTYLDRYHYYPDYKGTGYYEAEKMTVKLEGNTFANDKGVKWTITSLSGDRMSVEYNSGVTQSWRYVYQDPSYMYPSVQFTNVQYSCKFTFRHVSGSLENAN